MDNKQDHPDDNDNGDDFSRRFGEKESRHMIETAFIGDEMTTRATSIITKALGDLPAMCPTCGDLCAEHCIKLRDAFFIRALFLGRRLCSGLDLYLREREFGVGLPIDTINAIYRTWAEIAILHELVEPQSQVLSSDEAGELEE